MIRRRASFSPLIASVVAAAFAACTDATPPTTPRGITARGHASGALDATNSVAYGLAGYGTVSITDPAIVSVSAGSFSGNIATVPPGATINLAGTWQAEASNCKAEHCYRTAFLAYMADAAPPVTGVVRTYDVHTIVQDPPAPFSASTTAPTTPGTYYIGVRVAEGQAADNGAASPGDVQPQAPVPPSGASYKIVVGYPAITPVITGTLGANNWYTSTVKVAWTVIDPNASIDSKTGCDDVTIATDGIHTLTCTATSASGTSIGAVAIKRDATPPTGSLTLNPANPTAAGWYNTPVLVMPNCADATSGLSANNPVGSDKLGQGVNPARLIRCEDNAGDEAFISVPEIKIDGDFPSLTASVSPNPVIFGGKATATSVASDALSGLAAPATCGAVNTNAVGSFTVQCSATDRVGHTKTTAVPYTVDPLLFSGFQSPIKNDPSAWNTPKAGSTVELTFSVKGTKSLTLPAGSPRVQIVPCPGEGYDDGGVNIAIAGRLSAEGNGVYTYAWKTEKSLAGKCVIFQLILADGVPHSANFQFR